MAADSVQYHLERMVPELEDLQERGFFSAAEIKSIVKQRTAHEYRIHRIIPLKSDFLRYIAFEENLERLRRKRKRRMGQEKEAASHGKPSDPFEQPQSSLSDYSIMRRIHGLYGKMLKKFSGDTLLWVQYFDWCSKVNSSKALGKNFAKAIQLHPTKPTFWVMAAAWEFEQNANMTSARVLLQRGLRINPESQKLWLEYFKLELLWIEKIKERRKVLFKDGVPGGATDPGQDDSKDESSEGVTVPQLQEEAHLSATSLERDPTVSSSTTQSSDTAALLKPTLTAMQQTLLNVLIPRAVYRNAIKTIPKDFDFRIAFLGIYKEFGAETLAGQEEVYESLREDFGDLPAAQSVLAERHVDGVDPTDPAFPAALKNAVQAFNIAVEQLPSPEMWERYADFLATSLSRVEEEHLTKYLTRLLLKTITNAHTHHLATERMYLTWAQHSAPLPVLQAALERLPGSAQLWISTISHSKDEAKQELYEKAIKAVQKDEQHVIWTTYLQSLTQDWAPPITPDSDAPDSFSSISDQFTKALSILSSTPHEDTILSLHLHFARAAGLGRLRSVYDRLIGTKTRSTSFYRMCIAMETEGAKRPVSVDMDMVARVRRLWEGALSSNVSNIDTWLDYIHFEMTVPKDFVRAVQLYWKATKCVSDQEEFVRRYEEMKGGL
ncbi:hypothetical protein SpCBS45565_g03279 [Spizellomyces sp. 'palustris']|nr:hypothetical protein SpCBS45565_g03279 [Spizellomyces sp. 'palustris']